MAVTQEYLDRINAMLQEQHRVWRESELPKLRQWALDSGYISREEVLDGVVSAEELLALGWPCGADDGIWRRPVQ